MIRKLPECFTWRVKEPSGLEVTGRFAGLGGVVRAETVARGRSMLDDSPGGEAVTVPVTVVVKVVGVTGVVGVAGVAGVVGVTGFSPAGESQAVKSRANVNAARSGPRVIDR